MTQKPDANSPTATSGEQVDAEELTEYLKIEADHFFRAELNHEQRASWLLTLSSGLLVLVATALASVHEGKMNADGGPYLVVASGFLITAVALALFALWPLAGRTGVLWNPFIRRKDRRDKPNQYRRDIVWQHYTAHRYRAEIKGTRVVWVLLCLLVGVMVAFAGVLNAVI